MPYSTGQLVAALRSAIGTSVTVGSKTSPIRASPEGWPFWWVDKTRRPFVSIQPEGVRARRVGGQDAQQYSFRVHYIMDANEASAGQNPYVICRERVEAIADKIGSNRTLGLSFVNDCFVSDITGFDNEINTWMAQRQIPLCGATIHVVITTWEAGS